MSLEFFKFDKILDLGLEEKAPEEPDNMNIFTIEGDNGGTITVDNNGYIITFTPDVSTTSDYIVLGGDVSISGEYLSDTVAMKEYLDENGNFVVGGGFSHPDNSEKTFTELAKKMNEYYNLKQ